jgi:diguanylate cyclase (GGDEF)-like protein
MADSTRGIAFLTEQIDAIERERDLLLAKSQQLTFLVRAFVDIIAAPDERALATAAIRGAWLGLGFSRALWFRIEGVFELNALYEYNGEAIVDSEYGGTLPDTSALYRITSRDSNIATGWAGDPDPPLFDARMHWVAAAVRCTRGDQYLFYVDGSHDRKNLDRSDNWMQELAMHAAFALDGMRMAAELERLAMRDPLTGLFNRRALMERLTTELKTQRRTGESLAYVMIDVDDFKRINDTRGHAGGDEALKTIAEILRTHTRETDVPARFAGDEFSLIMPRTDRASAQAVMERIVTGLRAASLSASMGVAFARQGDDERAVMARADAAVYAAKAAGKDGFQIAD